MSSMWLPRGGASPSPFTLPPSETFGGYCAGTFPEEHRDRWPEEHQDDVGGEDVAMTPCFEEIASLPLVARNDRWGKYD